MNKHPRNPATLREKSRRRLLRRIEKCEKHLKSHSTDGEVINQLARLKESLAVKFPAPVPVEAPAPKLKKPRAKKITEVVLMGLGKTK